MTLKIIENYLTKNRCYQQARKRTAIGIQVHSIGTAQNTAQAIADYWNQPSVSACVHYIVDAEVEGKVLHILPDTYYAWADGGYGNHNLITFEIAESDYMRYTGNGANYAITNPEKFKADIMRGYNTAVQLCAYLCNQHGWNPMAKLSSGLYLISSHDEGRKAGLSTAHVDPTHIWSKFGLTMDGFRKDVAEAMKGNTTITKSNMPSSAVYRIRKAWDDEKSQIGAYTVFDNAKNACKEGYTVFDQNGKAVYVAPSKTDATETFYRVRKTWDDAKTQIGAYKLIDNAKANCPLGYAVYDENGKEIYRNTSPVKSHGLQAKDLNGLTEAEKIKKVAPIYQKVAKDTGMLASVGLAQFCLESGYGTTDLAQNANNMHGMKASLSGNSWDGSVWDGKSVYTKRTAEQDSRGNVYYVTADFRKYPNIEASVRDRAAYFIGAKNGSALRYPNINKITNAEEQIRLIKKGGYATDVKYVDKLLSLVNRFNLTQYDEMSTTKPQKAATNTAKSVTSQTANASTYATTPQGFLNALKDMNAKMMADRKAGKKWIYSNHGVKQKWAEAVNVRKTNCANMVVMALKLAGVMPNDNKYFYGSKGKIKGNAAFSVQSIMQTIHVNSKKTVSQAIKDGTLQAGDVVLYQNLTHTNAYAGNGTWYDGGRAYCNDRDTSHEGQEFVTWYGKTVYDNQKISYILRIKSAAAPTTYTVQAGVFSVKNNADKLVAKLKIDGFSAIIKKDGSNYIVQCGAFSVKANADKLVADLKAKGYSAIIK